MRVAVWQQLTDNCTIITSWLGPYTSQPQTTKPYGVITFLGDVPAVGNVMGAYDEVRVWVYDDAGDFVELDKAIGEVRRLLDGQLLRTKKGQAFRLEWTHTGRDFYDDGLKAYAKHVTFRIPKLR